MRERFRLVAIVWIVFMLGCSNVSVPRELLDELVLNEQKERVAIGWIYQQHELNVIVLTGKPEVRKYALPTDEGQKITASREQPVKISEGTDALRSPDGKWITYRTRDNKFVLADATGKVERTLLDGKRVLTPLQWSPDSKYLLYVQKGGTWDSAALRCGNDPFYVMVYRLSDRKSGAVFQGCQGYPYWELQWIRVPATLPV